MDHQDHQSLASLAPQEELTVHLELLSVPFFALRVPAVRLFLTDPGL
jgi:hypothetical protein